MPWRCNACRLPVAQVGRRLHSRDRSANGQKPDDQIYWAIIGRDPKLDQFVHVDLSRKLVPMKVEDNKLKSPRDGGLYVNYFHTLAEAKTITLPPIDSARIFFSVGEPCTSRPTRM